MITTFREGLISAKPAKFRELKALLRISETTVFIIFKGGSIQIYLVVGSLGTFLSRLPILEYRNGICFGLDYLNKYDNPVCLIKISQCPTKGTGWHVHHQILRSLCVPMQSLMCAIWVAKDLTFLQAEN